MEGEKERKTDRHREHQSRERAKDLDNKETARKTQSKND